MKHIFCTGPDFCEPLGPAVAENLIARYMLTLGEGQGGTSVVTLDKSFVDRLEADGFCYIGRFGLEGPVFSYHIEAAEAGSWLFSVYAWISFEGGGTIVRIGKSEGDLIGRINQYKNSLNTLASAMLSGQLGPNRYYAGDTPPWELEGWRGYTVPFSGGLIFAKQVAPKNDVLSAKKALENEELRLIREHNPPLNGTSRSDRLRCRAWAAAHGPTIAVSKLTGLPIERKAKVHTSFSVRNS